MSKSKHKHVGSGKAGRFFRYMSKKLVRPAGFKKIRTSTGAFKTFSRSARGKEFRFFGLHTRSSKSLKNRLNYMNERIAGKTQKIESYAAKLKEAQLLSASKRKNLQDRLKLYPENSKKWNKINEKLEKLEPKLEKKFAKMTQKVEKARKNLTKKLKTYGPKQKKYQALMQKKIYKSQKRLDKGFTKTCRNLKKTGKSAIGCLDAFEKCKETTPSLDLGKMTKCINLESETMGVPSNLKEGDVTQTMTKLADSHFLRRLKRRRHLREIKRITKHGDTLEQSVKESSATIKYGEKLKEHEITDQAGFNKLGQYSKERVIYKNIAKSNPKMTAEEIEKKTFEQFDKGEIASRLRKEHPNITPEQLTKRTDEIYKIQKSELNRLGSPSEGVTMDQLRDKSKLSTSGVISDEIGKNIGQLEKEAAQKAQIAAHLGPPGQQGQVFNLGPQGQQGQVFNLGPGRQGLPSVNTTRATKLKQISNSRKAAKAAKNAEEAEKLAAQRAHGNETVNPNPNNSSLLTSADEGHGYIAISPEPDFPDVLV